MQIITQALHINDLQQKLFLATYFSVLSSDILAVCLPDISMVHFAKSLCCLHMIDQRSTRLLSLMIDTTLRVFTISAILLTEDQLISRVRQKTSLISVLASYFDKSQNKTKIRHIKTRDSIYS